MNLGQAQNAFLVGFDRLLADVERELGAAAPDPYAGAGRGRVLEAQTRLRFFDEFATLLGWDLGAGGDMAQEARIRAETTTYMDYVGINQLTRAPVVLWEVKAWEKPFIGRARGRNVEQTPLDTLVEGIRYFLSGEPKAESPVTLEWYEYIEQVAGYVTGLMERHGHALTRVVLSSGQWVVIFKNPVRTFVDGNVREADIVILRKADFFDNASLIFSLLARQILVGDVPFSLRPAQLQGYLSQERLRAAYRGILVRYQSRGISIFAPKPQIDVYPALVLERTDGVFLTVVTEGLECELLVDKVTNDEGESEGSQDNIDDHLERVQRSSDQLLAACSGELGFEIRVSPISEFGGFPQAWQLDGDLRQRVQFVRRPPNTGDEWLIVTGNLSHFLRSRPAVEECRFHMWAACSQNDQALMRSAISSPSTDNPRSFFVDGQMHHCAHRTLDDWRAKTCYIREFDQRVCCQACIFSAECWLGNPQRNLPCGT
ncbi:hypothetical protein LGN07_09915 [Burkholderia cepacia]|uniref:hypothetical protein n=1 Tax=Burkholderia cepacia TaxID=292 RepID=UPI000753F9DE|nr:hypothetical protein [Burkholderia cepacia]KVS34323.1 hypothetical protein WK36_12900 [Burkholderia cepacia]MCA8119032.1 hypothetical protein [Burkholderia cepacia]